jgi:hypothetical protein
MKQTITKLLGGAILAALCLVSNPASATTITATWDWTTNSPTGIQSVNIDSNTGYVESSVSGVSMFVDASGGGKLKGNSDNAQFNTGTKLRVPVVSTNDVVTFVANSYKYKGVTIGSDDFDAGDPVVLTRTHTATADEVAKGYVVITSKGDYLNKVSVELAYMPVSSFVYSWDWHNGIPSSITSSSTEGTDANGSIESDNGLSLNYLAATSGAYVKLQYNPNSGNAYAQFNTNTAIRIPVSSTSEILTVVSFPGQYNYTVGGDAATSNTTVHNITAAEVTVGYTEIIATSTAYLYSITLEKRATATIGSYGWATFSNSAATDFTNLAGVVDAYAVTGASGAAITTSAVTTAAANTGLLLKANAGTYAIPLVSSGTDLSGSNLLKAGPATVNYNDGAGYNYVLGVNAGVAAFQKIVSGTNGTVTVPAGKAYLALTASPGAPVLDITIDGISTGIDTAREVQQTGDGIFYNLAGQRVAQPTKGLYIVNGKKIIIK